MPFQKVPDEPKHSILLIGPSGSGKTSSMLTYQNLAVTNSDDGSKFYKPPALVSYARDLDSLKGDIADVRAGIAGIDAYGIDSGSIFYDRVKDEEIARSSKGRLDFQGWAQVNHKMKRLWSDLTHLPVHLIVTAREEIQYKKSGENYERIGVRPDLDKAAIYAFDWVVHMQSDYSGVLLKWRGFPPSRRLSKVDFDTFARLAAASGAAEGYNVDDVFKALQGFFQKGGRKRFDSTIAAALKEGRITSTMSTLEVIDAIKERAEEKHPDETLWFNDFDLFSQVDEYFKKSFGMTTEQFLQGAGRELRDFKSAQDLIDYAQKEIPQQE